MPRVIHMMADQKWIAEREKLGNVEFTRGTKSGSGIYRQRGKLCVVRHSLRAPTSSKNIVSRRFDERRRDQAARRGQFPEPSLGCERRTMAAGER